MKISSKLEEMVADLVSDEKQKREEVEAVLSKIHELTEGFKSGSVVVERLVDTNGNRSMVEQVPEGFEPAPRLSQAERIKNFTAFRERMGDPPARALEVAEEMSKDEP